MFLTKTYIVEDCVKYIQTPSDYQTSSVPNGNYKILWNGKFTSTSDFTSAINDGTSNYVGVASRYGNIGFYNPNNFLTTDLTADGLEHTFELDYNSGTWTFKHNNESVNDTRAMSTSNFRVRTVNSNAMHDFKIKPL